MAGARRLRRNRRRRSVAAEEILQRIDGVVCVGELQAGLLRDRPLGAHALGEFGELGKDRFVLRGRRSLLSGSRPSRRRRFGRDRLDEAGERGERVIAALGRRGLSSVEIEQRGINALARRREDGLGGTYHPDREGGLNEPEHRATHQGRLQKREELGQRLRITCLRILRPPADVVSRTAQPAHQKRPRVQLSVALSFTSV